MTKKGKESREKRLEKFRGEGGGRNGEGNLMFSFDRAGGEYGYFLR